LANLSRPVVSITQAEPIKPEPEPETEEVEIEADTEVDDRVSVEAEDSQR
jgi:hypothetical protein